MMAWTSFPPIANTRKVRDDNDDDDDDDDDCLVFKIYLCYWSSFLIQNVIDELKSSACPFLGSGVERSVLVTVSGPATPAAI